jgi:uncharacterized membrane protein SpoIIM required for sporulation
MKVAELLERRRESWSELDAMCRELELHRARKLGVVGALQFARAYRSACADLALADAYQLPPHTVQYLHELVGRAHNQLYRSQMFRWQSWADEVFRKVPARILYDRSVWLAFVVFGGIFLAAMLLGYASPEFSKEVVGEAALESVEQMYSKPIHGRDGTASAFMGGFYVFNNAGIGLRCFAAGLLLGVGGLFITVSNALQLGTIFGYMINADGRDNFFEFVTAHGPFELTAIVLSSAAGMRLGFSLVSTGGLARWASVRKALDEATPTMAVAVILFCLAAAIEGFLSPSSAPYPIKAGVAVVSTLILVFYVGVLGWRGVDADAD